MVPCLSGGKTQAGESGEKNLVGNHPLELNNVWNSAPGSYLWHRAWSNSGHRDQSWSWSWNWRGGGGLGRGEGVLRRHAVGRRGGYESWDSVRRRDRLWLRRRNRQGVA